MAQPYSQGIQSWITSFPDESDQEQNIFLEENFFSFVYDPSISAQIIKEKVEITERLIVTRQIRPSPRQRTRFWYYVAQIRANESRYGNAFETLILCSQDLSTQDSAAIVQVHSLLAEIALKQGYLTQAYMSSLTVAGALRNLLPHVARLRPPPLEDETKLHNPPEMTP